jgi:hypothetical protein
MNTSARLLRFARKDKGGAVIARTPGQPSCGRSGGTVAVGTGLATSPPRRSRRAAFPHRALAGGRARSGGRGGCSAAPIRRQATGTGCVVRFCARSIASRLPSLRPSPLPSTPSAAARRGLVRALRQYYEARPTPRLFHGSFGSSPSCRGPGSPQRLRARRGLPGSNAILSCVMWPQTSAGRQRLA